MNFSGVYKRRVLFFKTCELIAKDRAIDGRDYSYHATREVEFEIQLRQVQALMKVFRERLGKL